MTLMWYTDYANIVLMQDNYTTSSYNLGERTYEAGKAYQVCPSMLEEIVQSGCGDKVDKERLRHRDGYTFPPEGNPVRPVVSIIPNVTKNLAASAYDVYYLTAGSRIDVPSNLSAYLISAGQAEAA